MTEKLKPTPGPWLILGNHVETVNETICEVFQPMTGNINEAEDNHRLIAEAGNVHHECGLSPRELLEGYRELRRELCEIAQYPENDTVEMRRIANFVTAKHKDV